MQSTYSGTGNRRTMFGSDQCAEKQSYRLGTIAGMHKRIHDKKDMKKRLHENTAGGTGKRGKSLLRKDVVIVSELKCLPAVD